MAGKLLVRNLIVFIFESEEVGRLKAVYLIVLYSNEFQIQSFIAKVLSREITTSYRYMD